MIGFLIPGRLACILMFLFLLIFLICFLALCFIVPWVIGTSRMMKQLSDIKKRTEKQGETIEALKADLQELNVKQKDINILVSAIEADLSKIADRP